MKKKLSKGEPRISCSVGPGMFSSERAISIDLPDGRKISALVDRRNVIPDRDVKPGEEYNGHVKVAVVEVKKDSAIVDLPQPGFTEGPRLKVPKDFVETK
ncbi:MAG TPA: hypothetical protein VNL14_13125 [Candidatus Acidoferrales bacterium]|nr:hypothetical protein [Candidatus Acidoferrales bacterium]